MIASSWLDPVLGIDLHWEMVPTPAPVPTPFPHPYIGLVLDVGGLVGSVVMGGVMSAVFGAPFEGPVLNWFLPATNTGTESKHVPGHFIIPPGTIWAPVPRTPKPKVRPGEKVMPAAPVKPENDSVAIFGSKTVTIGGSNAVRLGDLHLSCSEPVRLPSSVTLAIPKGAPILIGGPPSLDLMAAFQASLRTRYVSDSLHALVSRLAPGRFRNLLNRTVCFFTGHPVDVASGKVMTSAVDAELPGPLPLRIERVYSSAFADRDGPLGHGWSLSLDQAIWTEPGKVVLLEEDGREIEFDTFAFPGHRMSPGDRAWQPMERLSLERLEGERWRVTSIGGVAREFGPAAGRRDGRAMIERVRSRCGNHEVAYAYDGRGLLKTVRDACGRIVGLERDEAGRVRALRLPAPSGEGWDVHREYVYDGRGDLVEARDARGHSWRFEYEAHLLVREADRTGLSFYFEYDGLGQDAWCTRTWGDGGIYDHRLAYDKVKKLTVVTDSLGFTTQYRMNVAGQVVQVVDPLGGVTRYEYDPTTLQKTAEIDALEHVRRWRHDARGNCTGMTRADGTSMALEYDADDQLVRAVDRLDGEWTWAYDRAGQLLERRAPNGERAGLRWEKGLLTAVEAPGGRWTTFEHDDQKNVSRSTAPGGAVTDYGHDRRGRLLRVANPPGAEERYAYDPEGNLIRVHLRTGHVQERSFDPEGCLLEARDPTRHVRYRYGVRRRVVAREEAGALQRFEYDSEARLIRCVNEAGEDYTFTRDPLGRVLAEKGFDGGVRRYGRDRLGRVVATTAPNGITARYTHDAASRVRKVERSDGTGCEYAYRADGALVLARNESATVRFERDALGRVVREVQGDFTVTSHFDAGGARNLVETSLGGRMAVVGDEHGRVEALCCGEDSLRGAAPTVRFLRDVLGVETRRAFSNGLSVAWDRDAAGRPTERRTTRTAPGGRELPVERRRYAWRGPDQIAAVEDSTRGTTRYEHDARGRLVAEITAGGTLHRAHDAAGNLFFSPDGTDRSYGPGGRLEAMGATRYVHDAAGNRVEKIDADQRRWRYRWNGAGLLATVERPDGLSLRFEYDAFARRTRKAAVRAGDAGEERVEAETRYFWDGSVLVHEVETGDPSPTTWYYAPGSFTPMARERAGERWTVSADHLGTPTEMYDASGQQTWRMRLDAVGGAHVEEGTATDCPWRWPGQYEDPETGLYFNRFRYYDPEAGTYLSPDPLRLLGGFALFQYCDDPLMRIDPFGLVDIIFRALRAADMARLDAGESILAKDAAAHATPFEHVLHGSETGYADQFISMTRDRGLAERWARKNGTQVAEIDLDKITSQVLDLSTATGRAEHLGDPSRLIKDSDEWLANKYARGAKELLAEGEINSDAVVDRYSCT